MFCNGFFTRKHSPADESYVSAREQMVREQIQARGITSPAVLDAMRTVERHLFVPEDIRIRSYEDRPLPIGFGQTISQPYIVAFMTELLQVNKQSRVLEIGTGSGYQGAVLSRLCGEVYSVEIIPELCKKSAILLEKYGFTNVHVRCGDGFKGWPEAAPFHGIIVTCAPERVPPPLVEQLASPGRMIIPVGSFWQELRVIEKKNGNISEENVLPVRFVPMTGQVESL